MPILNYTTKVSSGQSIGEIQECLADHGARRTIVEYDEERNPIALTFGFVQNGREIPFRLPCNFTGIKAVMDKKRVEPRYKTKKHCIAIGWRIIKDWVEAQMALTEADLATTVEVFLPYAITKMGGKTMYELSQEPGSLLLEN